jgi:TrpR-related protein YerC/YecD
MNAPSRQIWNEPQPQQLAEVLSAIAVSRDMQKFLGDVMTEKEIIEISARLEAARMLTDGERYTNVIAATKLSSRTVARISDWLKNGYGGYAIALGAIAEHHAHIPPARAD